MCLTAGWPFLTAAAFVDTDERVVVVVMNEATKSTSITLTDSTRTDNLRFGISATSIQTIVY
jgi:hypothetical protein